MTSFATLIQVAKHEVKWTPLARSILCVSPWVVLLLITQNGIWLSATLVTMSTMIAQDRLDLTPFGVALHGVAIMCSFAILTATYAIPPLFVVFCMVLAVGSISLTAKGRSLRTLGNFTFIPALYLTVEMAEKTAPNQMMAQAIAYLPYLCAGVLPILVLSALRKMVFDNHGIARACRFTMKWSFRDDFGDRVQILEASLIVALAVGLTTVFVEWGDISHGQWVIWSAASVVTGEAGTERHKFRRRTIGVLVGVPLGILLGFLSPHTPATYSFSVIAAFLTLIAFRTYLVGFALRCAFIALALTVSNQTVFVAAERVSNVIAGGIVGVICIFGVRFAAKAIFPKAGS